ncbi:hypothetical protein HMSSN036_31140 [Paenibacillus macerans]|nr:hypothetical protein HMSSN036_31140 [Paenibacillus macerans]
MRKILSCIRFAVILTLAVSMLFPVSSNVWAAEAETESSLAGGASGATEKLSSGGGEAPLSPLWQVGNPDNSSAEFAAEYANGIESVSYRRIPAPGAAYPKE